MTFNILAKGLLSILGVAAVGAIQYSTLAQLTDKSQDSSAVSRSWYTEKSIEKNVEQIKIMAKAPSLGFRNVFADSAFVNFLQYFGDDARAQLGYSYSPVFFDAVLAHDPYYKDFYLFLSGSTTGYAGEPQKTVDLMQSGLSKFKAEKPADSYYIWRYKAADELLFLGKEKAAQKSYETAAKWAAESNDADSLMMSRLSQQTADFLADNPDSKLAQINAWASILTTAFDDEARAHAVSRIRALGGDVVLSESGQFEIKYPVAEESSDNQQSDI